MLALNPIQTLDLAHQIPAQMPQTDLKLAFREYRLTRRRVKDQF